MTIGLNLLKYEDGYLCKIKASGLKKKNILLHKKAYKYLPPWMHLSYVFCIT